MKKIICALVLLCCLPVFSSDFKWSHSYQDGSSQELLSLANKLAGPSAIKSAPTDGFAVQRPAFSLKCGKGTVSYEMDEQKVIRGIYFEGEASVSFNVSNTIEQDHLQRYINKRSLDNEAVAAVYILPLGECGDLPKMSEAAAVASVYPKMVNLKEALRRNCMDTLRDVLNSQNMDSRDILVVFEFKGDVWAYRHDSLSETEVQLLRLSHPKAQAWYIWDQAVAIHETKTGALIPEITSEEYASKFNYDVKNYEISYNLDDSGKLISGEVKLNVFLKKPHKALTLKFCPVYTVAGIKAGDEDAYFLKEEYSKTWGYYEDSLLVGFKTPKEGNITLTFKVRGQMFRPAGHEILEGGGYLYLQDEDYWFPKLDDWDGSTYKIIATVPKENEVITVGEMLEHTTNADQREMYVWESKIPIQAATMVMGEFIHTKIDVEGMILDVALPKGIRSNILTQAQKYTLTELKNNVIFFSKIFGPIPYPTIKVAITPFAHGRGFPTMLLIYDQAFFRSGTTAPEQLMAHETAHQWWGNLVSPLSYRDTWLSEGMAEFSSMLYMRGRFSESRVKIYNENMIWGGQLIKPPTLGTPIESDSSDDDPNHMSDHKDAVFSTFPALNFKETGAEPAQDVPFLEGPICLGTRLLHTCTTYPSMGYNYIVYSKSYFVFNMLLSISGFTKEGNGGLFRGFQTICTKYKGQKISTKTFFNELEGSMKIPLGVFLKSWYESNGIPTVEAKTTTVQKDGKYVVIAEARTDQDLFFGVPVRIQLPDKKTAEYILIFQNKTAKGEWALPSKPRDVEIDPARGVFCDYGKLKN
jgi:hypothetical protein